MFNPHTYPNFLRFLNLYPHLRSAIRETEMSFCVSRDDGAFEWAEWHGRQDVRYINAPTGTGAAAGSGRPGSVVGRAARPQESSFLQWQFACGVPVYCGTLLQ